MKNPRKPAYSTISDPRGSKTLIRTGSKYGEAYNRAQNINPMPNDRLGINKGAAADYTSAVAKTTAGVPKAKSGASLKIDKELEVGRRADNKRVMGRKPAREKK